MKPVDYKLFCARHVGIQHVSVLGMNYSVGYLRIVSMIVSMINSDLSHSLSNGRTDNIY